MSRTPSLLALACLLTLGAPAGQWSVRAQTPEQVLSDTADYCAELELQVDAEIAHSARRLTPEITALHDDGEGMCERGEIRGGIVRLRRALTALRRGP